MKRREDVRPWMPCNRNHCDRLFAPPDGTQAHERLTQAWHVIVTRTASLTASRLRAQEQTAIVHWLSHIKDSLLICTSALTPCLHRWPSSPASWPLDVPHALTIRYSSLPHLAHASSDRRGRGDVHGYRGGQGDQMQKDILASRSRDVRLSHTADPAMLLHSSLPIFASHRPDPLPFRSRSSSEDHDGDRSMEACRSGNSSSTSVSSAAMCVSAMVEGSAHASLHSSPTHSISPPLSNTYDHRHASAEYACEQGEPTTLASLEERFPFLKDDQRRTRKLLTSEQTRVLEAVLERVSGFGRQI
jgi:hypothetical protein